MFKKLNKKGFTLAELLIVVAIIGVLVAVSIPIFTSQLDKARDATSIANLRSAYAEYRVDEITGTVSSTGYKAKIATTDGDLFNSGIAEDDLPFTMADGTTISAGEQTITFSTDSETGAVTATIGSSSNSGSQTGGNSGEGGTQG